MGKCCNNNDTKYAPRLFPISTNDIGTDVPLRPSGTYHDVIIPIQTSTNIIVDYWNGTLSTLVGTYPLGTVINYDYGLVFPSTIVPIQNTINGVLPDAWTTAVTTRLQCDRFAVAGQLVSTQYQLSVYTNTITTLASIALPGTPTHIDYNDNFIAVSGSISPTQFYLAIYCVTPGLMTWQLKQTFYGTYEVGVTYLKIVADNYEKHKKFLFVTMPAYTVNGKIQLFSTSTIVTAAPPGNWFIMKMNGCVTTYQYVPSGVIDFTYNDYLDSIILNENYTQVFAYLNHQGIFEQVYDDVIVTDNYRFFYAQSSKCNEVIAYKTGTILVYAIER